jgi:hypothetical protein
MKLLLYQSYPNSYDINLFLLKKRKKKKKEEEEDREAGV